MLAQLTLLLHEMTDSLRGRIPPTRDVLVATDLRASIVLVTGLASRGKTRLVEALERRLASARVVVRVDTVDEAEPKESVVHVHAETDFEAMVEGALERAAKSAARGAEIVVPVDWEPVERSVQRVIETLISRGIAIEGAGS